MIFSIVKLHSYGEALNLSKAAHDPCISAAYDFCHVVELCYRDTGILRLHSCVTSKLVTQKWTERTNFDDKKVVHQTPTSYPNDTIRCLTSNE